MADAKPIEFPDKEPPVPSPDAKAKTEIAGMNLGVDLSSRRAMNQLNALARQNSIEGHAHNVLCVAIYVIGFTIIACLIFILGNYLFNWVDQTKVDKLKDFLFSGMLGALFNEGRKRLIKKPDSE